MVVPIILYPGQKRPQAPEPPPAYEPEVLYVPGNMAGNYAVRPLGCILHGTRSGLPRDVEQEFLLTVAYVRNGAGGLGWTVTIGHDRLAEHMAPDQWGWNARAASARRLAAEFAQANVSDPITDGQVRAFCWWWAERVLARWPGMPLALPTHAEVERWGETGVNDGKSDVYPYLDPRAAELRTRILTRLRAIGVHVP